MSYYRRKSLTIEKKEIPCYGLRPRPKIGWWNFGFSSLASGISNDLKSGLGIYIIVQ